MNFNHLLHPRKFDLPMKTTSSFPAILFALAVLLIQMTLHALGQPVPGHYIAVFKPSVPDAAAAARELANPLGLQVSMVYQHSIRGFAFHGSEQAAEALARNPRIAYVEQDQIAHINTVPELPTGVRRVGIDADLLAIISPEGNPVEANIAIIDTGLQRDHPDLNLDLEPGGVRFFFTSVKGKTVIASDSKWDDDNGHGTHVGGTAAANGQIVGVAPGARLTAVKVLNSNGSGNHSLVIAGIDWVAARAHRIDVANMSLGGGFSQAVNDAVNSASTSGVVFVVSAGNASSDAGQMSPASAESAITVSALSDLDGASGGLGTNPDTTKFGCRDSSGVVITPHEDDTLACFSNFGAIVDVCAPGVLIKSTYLNSTYKEGSGTSMAAPHVAGAAALFIARNRDSSLSGLTGLDRVSTVTHAIISTGWRQGQPGYFSGDKDEFMEPLLNVRSMLYQPTVRISDPADGDSFAVGDVITLNASAAVNGEDWTPWISWRSSISGPIGGSGGDVTTSLSEGNHTITASITDALNTISGSDSITITVGQPSKPNQLFLEVWTDKAVYSHGELMRSFFLVTDQENQPVSGATVRSVMTTAKGGTLTASGTTDANGLFEATLKINAKQTGTGTYIIKGTATKTGYPPASAETTFLVK
jgi:subtilisin